MKTFAYLCSVNSTRNSNKLSLEYCLDRDDKLVVKVRYGERVRDAEASWDSVSAAMDRLMVPVAERIALLRQEYKMAPTEGLFTEYIEALTRFRERLQPIEENQRTAAEQEIGVSVRQPLTPTAKKIPLRGMKTMQMREHFTPVAEVSAQTARAVLDNLIDHQYISADSRSTMALAFGWSETRKRAEGIPQKPSSDMIIWQRNVYILRYMILTLLGREETTLDHMVMSSGSMAMLPAGVYGRKPILAPPTAGERHWQLVSAWFIDRKGRSINADSLRSTRYPSSPVENANFKEEILSCFAPLLLAPPNRKLIQPVSAPTSLAEGRKLVLTTAAVHQG